MLTNIEHWSLNAHQHRTMFTKNEHWSLNAHQHRTLEFSKIEHWSLNAHQHQTLESQCSPKTNIGVQMLTHIEHWSSAKSNIGVSPKQNRTASASLPRKISAAQSGDPTQHCLLSYCAAVLVKVIPASRVPGADMFDAACKASLQAEQHPPSALLDRSFYYSKIIPQQKASWVTDVSCKVLVLMCCVLMLQASWHHFPKTCLLQPRSL